MEYNDSYFSGNVTKPNLSLLALKPLYWYWVVVKKSAAFTPRESSKESKTASAQNTPTPCWVLWKHFKGKAREESPRVYDQIVHNSLVDDEVTGLCHRG